MKTGFRRNLLVALVALSIAGGWAQRTERDSGNSRGGRGGVSSNNGVINFQETNKRNTQKTERDDRKKKEEEERKKKEEEEKRRKEREARWGGNNNNNKPATTMANGKQTSGTKTGGKPGGAATKPVNAGGSSDPTLRDVTAVMYDAVKTQRVDFDPVKAKNTPGILLLNAPRNSEAQRIRAGEASIAEPL